MVFVGDRGMITEARVKVLKEQGVGFITALRAPQIQKLTLAPHFQLSLFDEQGLCEVIARVPGRAAGHVPQPRGRGRARAQARTNY